MNHKFFFTCLLLLTIGTIITIGCNNKGCTDKKAINYSVVANKNDRSCEYCDSTNTQTGSAQLYLIDNNFSSIHYQETVAKFTVSQYSLDFNDVTCGNERCEIIVAIENMTNQDFDLYYTLQSFGNVFFFYEKQVTVPAFQTINDGAVPDSLISNPCGFFSSGSLSVSNNSAIIYH